MGVLKFWAGWITVISGAAVCWWFKDMQYPSALYRLFYIFLSWLSVASSINRIVLYPCSGFTFRGSPFRMVLYRSCVKTSIISRKGRDFFFDNSSLDFRMQQTIKFFGFPTPVRSSGQNSFSKQGLLRILAIF